VLVSGFAVEWNGGGGGFSFDLILHHLRAPAYLHTAGISAVGICSQSGQSWIGIGTLYPTDHKRSVRDSLAEGVSGW
jgi:hypothetical protein